MIRLKKGLYLEKSNVLLPWGISRDQAWRIGSPASGNPANENDKTRIRWDDVILDGLEVALYASLPDERNALNELSLGYRGVGNHNPFYVYLEVFKHLVSKIGTPTQYECPAFTYGPVLKWKHDNCIITIYTFEKYGDVFEMEILRTQ